MAEIVNLRRASKYRARAEIGLDGKKLEDDPAP